MQSPAFLLAWRHLESDPALGRRADGDVKGIGSGPSEEETLREAWGLDVFPDSIFDNGTKPTFEKSLLLTALLAK